MENERGQQRMESCGEDSQSLTRGERAGGGTKKDEGKNLKRVMVRDGICVFYPILAPIPNFIQIGRKIQKLKIFNNLDGFG